METVVFDIQKAADSKNPSSLRSIPPGPASFAIAEFKKTNAVIYSTATMCIHGAHDEAEQAKIHTLNHKKYDFLLGSFSRISANFFRSYSM